MSDFLNYLRKDEQKKMTEEEKFARHKQQKQQIKEATFDVDDFDEDDFDDDELTEAHRVVRRPAPPARKPMPNYPAQPAPQPVYEPEYEPEDIPTPAPAPQPRRIRRVTPQTEQVEESYIPRMNPALTEAYDLIDEMKNKMEMMFFKYGMTGLEKLNECMLDMCDEIMNPPKHIPEPEPEPVVEKTLPRKKAISAKPTVKKTTTVKPTVVSKPKPVKNESDILKEKTSKLNDLCENADLSELGNTLVMQSDVQENPASKTLAKIEARSKALAANNTKKQEQVVTENEVVEDPIEDLEIVPDGENTIEVESYDEDNNLENIELDIPAEQNEEE